MIDKITFNKIIALDNFCNDLMDVFIDKCKGNDFNKLNLLTISDIVDEVHNKQIDKLVEECENS